MNGGRVRLIMVDAFVGDVHASLVVTPQ